MKDMNYNLLRNALNASSMRQEIISSNISNVNTDNYKVGQVQFESLLSQANNSLRIGTNERIAYWLRRFVPN
jgi:flagellar basal-body rod protein FlgB